MILQNKFEALVAEAIEAIPEKFQKLLSNVAIVIEDEPSAEQKRRLRLRRDHTLFGLYEGVPQTSRGSHYYWVLPDKITIFKKPILEASRNVEALKRIVRDTVWHEIAHHFGMDEPRVRRAEQRRRLR